MEYTDKLELILNEMQAEKKLCDQAVKRAPHGTLHIEKNGGYYACKQVMNRNNSQVVKAIGRDKVLVRALAEKEFFASKSRLLQQNIESLSAAVGSVNKTNFQTVFNNMKYGVSRLGDEIFFDAANNGILVPHPVQDPSVPVEKVSLCISDMTVEEWAVKAYRENTSHMEHKVHKGHFGLLYRSRHEMLCCERLLQRGKAFHYDQVIELIDVFVSPDIILPDRAGVFTFLEIAGLETEKYMSDLSDKIAHYEDAGIMLGRNLAIIRPEANGAIDLNKFDRIVDAYAR